MVKKVLIGCGVAAVLLVALAVVTIAVGRKLVERHVESSAATPLPPAPGGTQKPGDTQDGFLYGRVTTVDGATYEGRLRFGGDEEAAWGDYFNGNKKANPWVAYLPPEKVPRDHESFEIFGWKLGSRDKEVDLGRLFMARFGDIARIDSSGRDVKVTLKSGSVFNLKRMDASDFDDGLRVWDATRGVVDLDSLRIRTIELLPTPPLADTPYRLQGNVHTSRGEFTGFIQWNRQQGLGTDELTGQSAEGDVRLRLDSIRSVARRQDNSAAVVMLFDGREIELSRGYGGLGTYVDDRRYGRVLVPWHAVERIDFSPGGSGPAYGDFPTGRPLTGSVTTAAGAHLTGRVVYDLDESETTQTLDAPSEGVDYTIPFGLVASILKERDTPLIKVILQSGEELRLEPDGDLGERNAGILVFIDGGSRSEYVTWSDVERVDFDRAPAMYPPIGAR